MYKIALLTYPYLLTYFEEVAAPFRGSCIIDVIPFEKQYLLLEIIPSLAEQYDGVCVFSALAQKFIEQKHPNLRKPVVYLDRRSVDYFKAFFLLLSDNRDVDFSRVWLDTSLLRPESIRTLDNVRENIAVFEERRTEYLDDIDLESFMSMEAAIETNARNLWQAGKYNMLVCRFADVASFAERENIPYIFIYPEKHRIADALENLLNRIRLEKQTDGMPASIMISPGGDSRKDFQEISQESIRIQKALLEFSKNYSSNFTIQFISNGYEILTSLRTVQKITGDFTNCQLGYYLFSTLGANVRIGYGVGNDIASARQNAILARRAAEDTGMSCVVTADGEMIPLQVRPTVRQPLGQGDNTAVVVERTGLSLMTIQRIRSALQFLGTNDVTNHSLAEALQVTVANANRFLNALIDGGNAEIVDTKKSPSKGRPSRVYRIRL